MYLAMEQRERARESLEKARKIIEATGYHRRDKDVAEMKGELGGKAEPAW